METDERDLINLCRHIYLIGTNEGLYMAMQHSKGNRDYFFDEKERDEAINELIDDLKTYGFMGYGCDQGRHGHCPPECKEFEDEEDE